jgi:hypothetical protein
VDCAHVSEEVMQQRIVMEKIAKLWLRQNEYFLKSVAVSASQKGTQLLTITSFRN